MDWLARAASLFSSSTEETAASGATTPSSPSDSTAAAAGAKPANASTTNTANSSNGNNGGNSININISGNVGVAASSGSGVKSVGAKNDSGVIKSGGASGAGSKGVEANKLGTAGKSEGLGKSGGPAKIEGAAKSEANVKIEVAAAKGGAVNGSMSGGAVTKGAEGNRINGKVEGTANVKSQVGVKNDPGTKIGGATTASNGSLSKTIDAAPSSNGIKADSAAKSEKKDGPAKSNIGNSTIASKSLERARTNSSSSFSGKSNIPDSSANISIDVEEIPQVNLSAEKKPVGKQQSSNSPMINAKKFSMGTVSTQVVAPGSPLASSSGKVPLSPTQTATKAQAAMPSLSLNSPSKPPTSPTTLATNSPVSSQSKTPASPVLTTTKTQAAAVPGSTASSSTSQSKTPTGPIATATKAPAAAPTSSSTSQTKTPTSPTTTAAKAPAAAPASSLQSKLSTAFSSSKAQASETKSLSVNLKPSTPDSASSSAQNKPSSNATSTASSVDLQMLTSENQILIAKLKAIEMKNSENRAILDIREKSIVDLRASLESREKENKSLRELIKFREKEIADLTEVVAGLRQELAEYKTREDSRKGSVSFVERTQETSLSSEPSISIPVSAFTTTAATTPITPVVIPPKRRSIVAILASLVSSTTSSSTTSPTSPTSPPIRTNSVEKRRKSAPTAPERGNDSTISEQGKAKLVEFGITENEAPSELEYLYRTRSTNPGHVRILAQHYANLEEIDNFVSQPLPDGADSSIEKLVAHLLSYPESNTIQEVIEVRKMRALFRWVADNISYDSESFASGAIESDLSRPETVLKRKMAVSQGFSEFLEELSRLANLKVSVLFGWSKGVAYDVGAEFSADVEMDHVWNKWEISGETYLLDVTWESRYENDHYWLTPPESFAVDHFPKDPVDQLLHPQISFQMFSKIAYYQPAFFVGNYTLNFSSGFIDIDVPCSGEVKIPVGLRNPTGKEWHSAKLQSLSQDVDCSDCCFVNLSSSKSTPTLAMYEVFVRPPSAGDFKVVIYGSGPNILEYRVQNSRKHSGASRFAYRYTHPFVLLEPSQMDLKKGSSYDFRLELAENILDVAISDSADQWTFLQQNSSNPRMFQILRHKTDVKGTLFLWARKEENKSFAAVARFNVID